MERFRNKYRVGSTRLRKWDYGWDGAYFITICTACREQYFGCIRDGRMQLSHAGVLADVFWHEIPGHAKNVGLDEFVVMPNHIHGIIILDGNNDISGRYSGNPSQKDNQFVIPGKKRYQNQGKNTISSIVGSYKSAVTKHARRLGYEMGWQSRFHDHLIRDNSEYQRIKQYIRDNPVKWTEDTFYTVSHQ